MIFGDEGDDRGMGSKRREELTIGNLDGISLFWVDAQ